MRSETGDRLRGVRRLCLLSVILAGGLAAQPKAGEWQSLFDGKSLGEWKETGFPRKGPVKVEGGEMVLGAGAPLTGVTWGGAFPKMNYEIRFEGTRRAGGDFFASLTFPVGESFATLVTGGWGGDIVGVSSLDGWDAADNETRNYFTFETGKWYAIRLEVTPGRIRAWIGEERVVDLAIQGREIGLRRGDIGLSSPLGFASYNTTGAVRGVAYRVLQ